MRENYGNRPIFINSPENVYRKPSLEMRRCRKPNKTI